MKLTLTQVIECAGKRIVRSATAEGPFDKVKITGATGEIRDGIPDGVEWVYEGADTISECSKALLTALEGADFKTS